MACLTAANAAVLSPTLSSAVARRRNTRSAGPPLRKAGVRVATAALGLFALKYHSPHEHKKLAFVGQRAMTFSSVWIARSKFPSPALAQAPRYSSAIA